LALAADVREPDATVGAVARQFGYGSPFAIAVGPDHGEQRTGR
jgi:transposase-like protein